MLVCQSCWETNEDSAVVCTFCKQPLRAVISAHPKEEDDLAKTTGMQAMRERQTAVDESVAASNRSIVRPSSPESYTSSHRVTVSVDQPGAGRLPRQHMDGASTRPDSPAAGRKIVGILVTYSWNDEGQIFPVYDGHNRIGRQPDQCEIAVPQDDTLSAINSHIIFRGNFTICDNVSLSGTYMDGERVESQLVPLRNYARIRAGSTHWTFIAIEPSSGEHRETKHEA